MKQLAALVCLWFAASGLWAEQEQTFQYRGLSQIGAGLSFGKDSGLSKPGLGMSLNNFTYLDPASRSSWYFSILSGGFLFHAIDGSAIADAKPLVLGYRHSFGGTGISLGANVAPVIGARYDGDLVLGSAYTGVGAALTAYFEVLPNLELAVSAEPVLNVARWGAPTANNLTYCDIVIYGVYKNNWSVRKDPW